MNDFVSAIENSFGGDMFDDLGPSDGFQINSLHGFGIDMFANDLNVMEDEVFGVVLMFFEFFYLSLIMFFFFLELLNNICIRRSVPPSTKLIPLCLATFKTRMIS